MTERQTEAGRRRKGEIALVLVNNSGIGGTERRFAQVYAALRARDRPVSLVINASLHRRLAEAGLLAKEPVALLLGEPVGRRCFRLRKLDYVLACLQLAWWLLRTRPAGLHLVLGGAYVALPAQWAGLAPAAMLSVVCPSLPEMVGSRLGLVLYRRALRSASLVDALTESIRDMVRGEGVPAARIALSSGSCVDTVKYRPATAKQPWVVFAGRLIDEKNPLLFVQACALVHRQVPHARFFLLGDGPLREQVEALRHQEGLDTCLEIGWRRDVAAVLSEAQVFASLQRMDNYPSQSLLEAMASGAAVVATDVGLTAKLVDATVGCRVPPAAEAVAGAMVSLLQDPGRAQALGRKARELVLREHSLDAYVGYLETQYAGLAGRLKAQPVCAASAGAVR